MDNHAAPFHQWEVEWRKNWNIVLSIFPVWCLHVQKFCLSVWIEWAKSEFIFRKILNYHLWFWLSLFTLFCLCRLEKLGALEWSKVVHEHQGWRLIACIWLHAGVIHLLANMLSLVFIGIRLEQQFGFGMLHSFLSWNLYFSYIINISDIKVKRLTFLPTIFFKKSGFFIFLALRPKSWTLKGHLNCTEKVNAILYAFVAAFSIA